MQGGPTVPLSIIPGRNIRNKAMIAKETIEAIASGTGFKSRTTFVNAFKRETGLKPSEYLRMAAAKER